MILMVTPKAYRTVAFSNNLNFVKIMIIIKTQDPKFFLQILPG